MAGVSPAPAVTGAVQTDSSVPSDATVWDTSTNWSPAESVTDVAVECDWFHTPTSTTSRSPARSAPGRVVVAAVVFSVCTEFCWTNCGTCAADGVTAAEWADSGEVPFGLVALTVNVYAVPLVRPVIVAFVVVTVVDGWAVDPAYGVTVYEVIGLPPSAGAVQLTVALALPGAALTPVGVPGALSVRVSRTIAAVDGTPLLLTRNSM